MPSSNHGTSKILEMKTKMKALLLVIIVFAKDSDYMYHLHYLLGMAMRTYLTVTGSDKDDKASSRVILEYKPHLHTHILAWSN